MNANANHLKSSANLPRWFWPGLFIVLATLAAYWPVYSAGFIWDDNTYVTENPLLTAPDGLWRIWFTAHSQSQYFPLVFTTLRMEYALWGLNPAGYHIVNVCLHIGNALLVWELLRRLALPGAWVAAAAWALHPVQVETVAWVTELKNTESTLFYLLAIFAWLHFCEGRGLKWYVLALALHAFALFAKTTACTLPAALLLVLWLKGESVNRCRILQVTPFLVLGLGMGALSVWWEKHLGNYLPRFHLLGGPIDRLLIATHALWFYAGKIFWPAELIFSYPHWDINPRDWQQYIWLVGCLLVLVALWLTRRRLGNGPAVGIIFFAAALSPMLGFIPLYTFYFSYVADHYQYFASLGLIALGVGLAAKFLESVRVDCGLQTGLAVLLLVVLGALTWKQCHIYKNLETLWTDTLAKNPRCWMARSNLGWVLAHQGRFDEAEAQYRIALAIYPDDSSIHYNYGNLLARMGRLDESIAQYHEGLRLAPEEADAHNNLGVVLKKQHRLDDAIAEYQRAIFYKPDFADAYYNLGNALSEERKMDAAVAAYQKAVSLDPQSEMFRKRLQAVTAPANGLP